MKRPTFVASLIFLCFSTSVNSKGLRCKVCFEVSSSEMDADILEDVWKDNIKLPPCKSVPHHLQNLGFYLSSLTKSKAMSFKAAAARIPSTLHCSTMKLTVPADPDAEIPGHLVTIYDFENTPITRENEADNSQCKESLDPQDFADMAVDLPSPQSLEQYSNVRYCICNDGDGCNASF